MVYNPLLPFFIINFFTQLVLSLVVEACLSWLLHALICPHFLSIFLLFRTRRCSRLKYFPCPSPESTIFPKIASSFMGKWYLEIKVF